MVTWYLLAHEVLDNDWLHHISSTWSWTDRGNLVGLSRGSSSSSSGHHTYLSYKQTWWPGSGALGTGTQNKRDLDEESLLKHTCSWRVDDKIRSFGGEISPNHAAFQTYRVDDCYTDHRSSCLISTCAVRTFIQEKNKQTVESGSTNSCLEARSDKMKG